MLSGARLMTLAGAGGVGKTRLAVELANRVLDARSDGIWFVDLAPLSDPTLIAGKLASVVEVPEVPGRSPEESLVAALRSREILLILDNCEHLIGAVATLAESLLVGCPRITIVATSREPLRLAGELVYRVPSLSLPPIDPPDSDCLADSEAVQLFLDRARQHRPDFALGPHNCATVARLCHRLDGIPLAIELAAARLRAIAIADIEKRLDDRFRLLTGGNRTALPRQQTLQALIDWSYELLTSSEKAVLERLSVFAGGFDLESAEVVVTCGHDADVLDEVVALLDKSLVQWDATNNRYRLLESVRAYGTEKLLARSPEAATATRMAHRNRYLELAETAALELNRSGQREWLDRLDLELDNLRGAISESLSDPNPEPALRLTHALRYFWAYRQPRAEGVQAANAALDRTDARAPTLLRGRALTAGSHLLASITAEYEAATERAQEALAIARALPNEHLRTDALCRLLAIGVYRGDERAHEGLAIEAQRAARAVGDPHLTANVLLEASSAAHVSHDDRTRALEEARELLREAGDQVLYVRALGALGYAALYAGDISAARSRLEEAVHLIRATDDARGLMYCLCNLGFALYLDHADDASGPLFEEVRRVAERAGDPYMVAHALLGLALVTARSGDGSGAATLHGAAEAIHARLGTRFVAVEARLQDADIVALRAGLGDEAFEHAYEDGRHAGRPVFAMTSCFAPPRQSLTARQP